MKKTKKLVAVDIAECSIFVVLMIVSAFIKIPFPLMPLTFQTCISVFSGLVLGAKKGVISMSVYAFMGLIGIPVFTSGGGFAYVLQPSFGYILGFIAGSFAAGIICGGREVPLWRYIVGGVVSFLVNYTVGVPYFILIWTLYLGRGEIAQYVVSYNLIYMPKDLILSILAAILAWKTAPYLIRKTKLHIDLPKGDTVEK